MDFKLDKKTKSVLLATDFQFAFEKKGQGRKRESRIKKIERGSLLRFFNQVSTIYTLIYYFFSSQIRHFDILTADISVAWW